MEYELPTTITKGKLDNKEKRSLNVASSKNPHTKESIYSNRKQPNYSAFSGLSSFASFNIFGSRKVPKSRFSCRSRAPGYYADMELGCKVRKEFNFSNDTKLYAHRNTNETSSSVFYKVMTFHIAYSLVQRSMCFV